MSAYRMRRGPGSLYRRLKSLHFLLTRDRAATLGFLGSRELSWLPFRDRLRLVRRFVQTTNEVRGYHTLTEMLMLSRAILERAGRPGLTVLEAGAGKGSSTAKLSLAVQAAGGRLLVFDSFQGIPDNDERHTLLDGRPTSFRAGAFRGSLASVRRVVERYGAIAVCEFHKGRLERTLPGLEARLDVVILDVDLLSATRVSLKELVPRLAPDGVLFSLDGQLVATHELLGDASFWRDEVGIEPPRIDGLGVSKLLSIRALPARAPGSLSGREGSEASFVLEASGLEQELGRREPDRVR